MTRGTTLQEVLERGARKEWVKDEGRAVDVLTVAEPSSPTLWGDLTREPLDLVEVRKTRDPQLEYFNRWACTRRFRWSKHVRVDTTCLG